MKMHAEVTLLHKYLLCEIQQFDWIGFTEHSQDFWSYLLTSLVRSVLAKYPSSFFLNVTRLAALVPIFH